MQVDYAPALLEKGLHKVIKEANEAIKQMNGSISGYMSPNVSIESQQTPTLEVEAWIVCWEND